ncbi:hypothetical protein Q7P35_002988 [Cladosporium inversicolor]
MSSKSEVLAWKRLVRYNSSSDGSVKYGEPILEDANADIAALAQQGKLKVHVLEGSNPLDAKPTSQEDHVKSLLGLLRVEDVPIIRVPCPTVYTKPAPAIADHGAAIPIPEVAQEQADYEGELTILIGRDAYDVSPEDALDYVAALSRLLERKKGKRVAIKGKFVFNTKEILELVEEAEVEALKGKLKKRRTTRAKALEIEDEGEEGIEESIYETADPSHIRNAVREQSAEAAT